MKLLLNKLSIFISFVLMIYDILTYYFAYYFSLIICFENIFSPNQYLKTIIDYKIKFGLWITLIIYLIFRLYNSIWRFASYKEFIRCIIASLISIMINSIGITLLYKRMPLTYYVIGGLLQIGLLLISRFSYRFIYLEIRKHDTMIASAAISQPSLLIGAGEAGRLILRDVTTSKDSHIRIVGIIDDDPNKIGKRLEDIPVIGGRDDILDAVEKYNVKKILFAISNASTVERTELLNICKESGCEVLVLPNIVQMANSEIKISTMRVVRIEDLLGREPIKVNTGEILEHLEGKVVLVTGGGGSIGSELCRQIAPRSPKLLVIFDVYENNAYDIEQELKHNFPKLNLLVLIGSVRDSAKINSVFKRYKPDIVFHAAAHKHVPLMEISPCEAIKNNVLGTYKTAYAALTHGCKRFVLISTDKAVNPTNIMGASKRICEMVIQSIDKLVRTGEIAKLPLIGAHAVEGDLHAKIVTTDNLPPKKYYTEFVAVRFGNVLGSNGSVIPLFRKQIEAGGPVTVTHPDIIRYFMTIPEAVSLVLQASTYAQGGEIFVLDMGKPMKIDTLARNLIKMCGLRPDIDIQIKYTGLRPGEKLYEEKLMAEEGMKTTPNHLIHIGKPIEFNTELFLRQLNQLAEISYKNDNEVIIKLVSEILPTYRYSPHGLDFKTDTYTKQIHQMME